MQVLLRLQWVRQVVRGRYMNAELSLAGLGLIVMGGLQDELFNLTIDRIQVPSLTIWLVNPLAPGLIVIRETSQWQDLQTPRAKLCSCLLIEWRSEHLPCGHFIPLFKAVSQPCGISLQMSAEMKHLEARFSGSIKRVQLDNQMIDATQPVVLAPATVAHAHSKTAQALSGQDSALVEFGVARSFANTFLGGGEQVGSLRRLWL